MNLPESIPLPLTSTAVSQECVGKPSYAEVVRGTRGTMVSQPKKVRLPFTELNAVNVRDNSVSFAKPTYFATNLI
jgi:hypothetical protein